jgi:polyphenol oxidase
LTTPAGDSAATPPSFEPVVFTRPPRGIVAGVSRRDGGASTGPYASLNMSFDVGDDAAAVARNRVAAAAAFGFTLETALLARQVHGADVFVASARDAGRGAALREEAPVADALVAGDAPSTLLVGIADCVPVFLAAEDGSAMAAVHAGWRGVAAGVLPRAIERLTSTFGVAPSRICAAYGPSIGPCCFETGDDVSEIFRAKFGATVLSGRRVDLRAALTSQLRAAGVDGEPPSPPCTRCESARFFSHRAAKGAPAGRAWGAIRRLP